MIPVPGLSLFAFGTPIARLQHSKLHLVPHADTSNTEHRIPLYADARSALLAKISPGQRQPLTVSAIRLPSGRTSEARTSVPSEASLGSKRSYEHALAQSLASEMQRLRNR
jgi:hypothetical protein